MNGIIGGGLMASIFTVFFVNMQLSNDILLTNIDKQVSYVGAKNTAEASIEKELLALKSEDINKIIRLNELSGEGVKKDMEYGFLNEGADTGYFDLEIKTKTSKKIDLGSTVGGDLVFEGLSNEDFFDTFVINYNKSTNADVLVEIIKTNKGGSNYIPCTFYNNLDDNCSYISKTVINSSDSTLNGRVIDGLQVYIQPGTEGYNNMVKVQGFNINSYNYRVSFSTLKGESVPFGYYVESGGIKKQVANNFIEIDTVGNAIDNFARMRLEKRITNDIQPNSKYVLFSDGEIAK